MQHSHSLQSYLYIHLIVLQFCCGKIVVACLWRMEWYRSLLRIFDNFHSLSEQAYLEAAESMLAADVASNKAIGAYGAQALYNNVGPLANSHQGVRVLTHCNTGRYAHWISLSLWLWPSFQVSLKGERLLVCHADVMSTYLHTNGVLWSKCSGCRRRPEPLSSM